MAPKVTAPYDHDAHPMDSRGADTSAAQEQLKARLSRKRTKTGCLTCRKRRIKCGEERPFCRNCIKSKRHCEGYTQRVVFKQPFYDFCPGPNGAAHITFQAGALAGPATPHYTVSSEGYIERALPAHALPRPVEQFVPGTDQIYQQAVAPQDPEQSWHPATSGGAAPNAPALYPITTAFQVQPSIAVPGADHQRNLESAAAHSRGAVPTGRLFGDQNDGKAMMGSNGLMRPDTSPFIADNVATITPPSAHSPPSSTQFPLRGYPHAPWSSNNAQTPNGHSNGVHYPLDTVTNVQDHALFATIRQVPPAPITYVPPPELTRLIDHQPPLGTAPRPPYLPIISTAPLQPVISQVSPEFYDYEAHIPASITPTQVLHQAAVEVFDDDYYDLESDEEMDLGTTSLLTVDRDRRRSLSGILHGNDISIQDMQTRRYDTFLYEGMLDRYRVEEHANPLKNPATARVFAHFISVTGPSLSIFERHPRNTSVLFTPGQVPFSQQGLWTYTMPLAALRHQGLLHAMLALASLHIARLTNASVTPSMQHYAWALKRVHGSVGHHKKRLRTTTIAASMLLGFYEIMTADHMKWNTHLAGSKQLFIETDFVGMMQQFKNMKMDKAARDGSGRARRQSIDQASCITEDVLEQIPDVSETIISEIVGRAVRYGEHGQVMTPHPTIPPELDLAKFEILKDLYWWYCKQDAYQSIVSGNALLMEYSRWANCPPRAPLGKLDAVYGSFDHLILLLGRIADFASRDRRRKVKQMDLNGGQWRPAPDMQLQRPSHAPPPPLTPESANGPLPGQTFSASYPQARASVPGARSAMPPQPPAFFGMAPPPNPNVQMPTAYYPINTAFAPQNAAAPDPSDDIHQATTAALEEYGRIRAALVEYADLLGDAFKPLSSEYQPPLDTAFGQAIFYRSFDIGCLWAIYNMALIIAIRSHPHMPPAAHMAAAIAAPQTAFYADEIGRIVAGIVPGPPDSPLNPSLGAALCESCMPSFFAAVQYQDWHQRHETVTRIFGIAQRTGWGTAELIANGCETAWVKAAAAGRGPPYERVVRQQHHSADPRLSGSWERLDPRAMPDERDETDRRHVRARPEARLNWAVGVMGTEEDEGIK